jgi:hypothetical protein
VLLVIGIVLLIVVVDEAGALDNLRLIGELGGI